MAFDANAYREAHRPWSFTVGARTYHARHVSALQVAEYDRRVQDAGRIAARHVPHPERYRRMLARAQRTQLRALRWLLRLAFPWRLSYALRGDPVTLLLQLEQGARAEALRDFFECLRGMSQTLTPPAPSIPGTPSRTPTPLQTR